MATGFTWQTTDCELVALDAATGQGKSGPSPIDDWKDRLLLDAGAARCEGQTSCGFTLVAKFGVRGSISAFDAETGKRIWRNLHGARRRMKPGRSDLERRWIQAREVVPSGSRAYLIQRRTPHTGATGNPSPWIADNRPGDNLYTDSTLAINIDTR